MRRHNLRLIKVNNLFVDNFSSNFLSRKFLLLFLIQQQINYRIYVNVKYLLQNVF